jgi:hypothetical protein
MVPAGLWPKAGATIKSTAAIADQTAFLNTINVIPHDIR